MYGYGRYHDRAESHAFMGHAFAGPHAKFIKLTNIFCLCT